MIISNWFLVVGADVILILVEYSSEDFVSFSKSNAIPKRFLSSTPYSIFHTFVLEKNGMGEKFPIFPLSCCSCLYYFRDKQITQENSAVAYSSYEMKRTALERAGYSFFFKIDVWNMEYGMSFGFEDYAEVFCRMGLTADVNFCQQEKRY